MTTARCAGLHAERAFLILFPFITEQQFPFSNYTLCPRPFPCDFRGKKAKREFPIPIRDADLYYTFCVRVGQ